MAYPSNFLKLTFGGSLAGGEQWSNSISLTTEIDLTFEDSLGTGFDRDRLFDHFREQVEALMGGMQNLVSRSTTLEWVKLAFLGPDGKYMREPISGPTSRITGTGSAPHPNEIALALSMQTDQWGARAKNGRIYLAGLAAPIDEEGLISVENRDNAIRVFHGFIRGLNNAPDLFPGDSVRVVVASAVGAGAFAPVTRVRVGRVPDTIRSRRTSLDERYGRMEIDGTDIAS